MSEIPSFFDRRISLAAKLIEQKKIDWLSIDVFDTSIYRRVPQPKDLFILLGHELYKRNALFPTDTAESFALIRIGAEDQAHHAYLKKIKSEEISLTEIYDYMPKNRFSIPASAIMALELEIEERLCHANTDIFTLTAFAQKAGVKIAFVSDTYFSESFLRHLLSKGYGQQPPDLVLASNMHRKSKRMGLMAMMLAHSKTDPRRILHIGDNPASDILAARQHKIRTLYLRKGSIELTANLLDEWGVDFKKRAPLLHPTYGDFGLTWLRTRINSAQPADSSYWFWYQWGAVHLGPILTYFADWSAQRLRQLTGTDAEKPQLLCLMREGRLLSKLMKIRAPDITTHETWINRQTIVKATLWNGTRDDLKRFINRPYRPTIEKICSGLKVPVPPNLPIKAELVESLIDPFFAYLQLPEIKKIWGKESKRAFENLFKHLEPQIGQGASDRIFLLDVGYNGTIQRALQTVCDRHFKNPVKTYGLYMGTGSPCGLSHPSLLAEGWLMAGSVPSDLARILGRSPEPFEQAITAKEGTLLEHDDNGHPICEDNPLPPWQIEQAAAVQKGILDFARIAPQLPASDPYLIAQIQRIFMRCFALPTYQEAKFIGNWYHDENFGPNNVRTLAANSQLNTIAALPFSDAVQIPNHELPWIFGAARLHSRRLSQRFYTCFSDAVEKDLFLADDQHLIKTLIFMDHGSGFQDKNSSLIQSPRSDRGVVHVKCGLYCPNGVPQSIAIQFDAQHREELDLICLRLSVYDESGIKVLARELSGQKELSEIKFMLALKLLPNISSKNANAIAGRWQLPKLRTFGGLIEFEMLYTLFRKTVLSLPNVH